MTMKVNRPNPNEAFPNPNIPSLCFICGYVYDSAEHDGVAFEDLPEDWKCPRCRQGKEKFNRA